MPKYKYRCNLCGKTLLKVLTNRGWMHLDPDEGRDCYLKWVGASNGTSSYEDAKHGIEVPTDESFYDLLQSQEIKETETRDIIIIKI